MDGLQYHQSDYALRCLRRFPPESDDVAAMPHVDYLERKRWDIELVGSEVSTESVKRLRIDSAACTLQIPNTIGAVVEVVGNDLVG